MTPSTAQVTAQLPLQTGGYALIDAADLPATAGYTWYQGVGTCGHVFRVEGRQGGTSKPVYLHRVVAQAPPGLHVSHQNGDPLDCRRDNLLLLTAQQKSSRSKKRQGTTSRYRGVSWQRQIGRWTAYLRRDGRQYHLGTFQDEEAAARAYDQAARKAFQQHASLNFPGGEESEKGAL
jgi:hypothetical protein